MTLLRVERIEDSGGLHALKDEWQALERSSDCQLPFLTFDWATSWWEHLREDKLAIRDELFLHVVRSPSHEVVAIAPLMRTCRPGYGPIRIRELQFFGADPNLTELRGVLAHPDHIVPAYRALLQRLHECSRAWDWLTFSGVPSEDEGLQRVVSQRLDGTAWVRDIPDYVLTLPDSWDAFKSSRSRNIKESLRKCYNAVKRDGYEVNVEITRSGPGLQSALDEFMRLHRARAQAEDGVHHNDVFQSQMAQRFLREVCVKFAQRGCLRVFVLRLGDTAVAARIGFVLGDSLYLYYSGFDPAYGKYSVMTTTVAEAIKCAIGEGLKSVNLSTGNDVSKTRWSPREHVYREAFAVSPRPGGALTRSAYLQARKLLEARVIRDTLGNRLARRAD